MRAKEGKVLAVIPARGGSKGVARKNLRVVGNKPLIAWTIEEALQSRYIDRVLVSTEDAEIASVSLRWGAEVLNRPQELAQDNTPGIEPVLHALQCFPDYDYLVLLQPTSPLRSVADIDGCFEFMRSQDCSCCIAVVEADKSPYWMYAMNDAGELVPLLSSETAYSQRQELPKTFCISGAIYIAKTDWLLENRTFVHRQTIGYPMPKERSLDIDTELDLVIADFLLQGKIKL